MAGCDDEIIIDYMQYTELLDKFTVTVVWNITNKLTVTRSKQAS
jgi:hypothetical protein